MIIKLSFSFVASCVCAYLYHAGGLGRASEEEKREDPWIPLFLRHSWVRDWICPLFSLIVLFTWWRPSAWWGYLLSLPSWILMAGALSTYWDFLFGKDNFYAHGFGVGLAFFLFYWAGMHWWAIVANSLANCVLMGWLCARTAKVTKEELGRGFIAAVMRVILKI